MNNNNNNNNEDNNTMRIYKSFGCFVQIPTRQSFSIFLVT